MKSTVGPPTSFDPLIYGLRGESRLLGTGKRDPLSTDILFGADPESFRVQSLPPERKVQVIEEERS